MRPKKIFFKAIYLPAILSLGFAFLPLIYWPWGIIKYEIPKVWFVLRFIEILCFLGLISGIHFIRSRKIDLFILFSATGFTVTAFLASLLGADFTKSILGNYYRGDGLITLSHLFALTAFLILFWEEKWNIQLSRGIVFGSQIVSLWTIILAVQFYILGNRSISGWENGAIGSNFGNPNFLAGYLLVTLPLTVYLFKRFRKQQIMLITAIAIQILAIWLTRSWGGIIGSVLFLYGWLLLSKHKLKFIFSFILFVILAILTFLYINKNIKAGFVAQSRVRIIRKTLLGAATRPVTGFGWANADYAFEKIDWPIKLEHDVYIDKSHGIILEVLATTGILGLIFYLILITRTGYLLVRRIKLNNNYWNKSLLLIFLLYLFHSQTNVISIGEELIFWSVVGIAGNKAGCEEIVKAINT